MKQLHFTEEINATPGKVWKILWDDVNYRKWTSVFSEGSYAVSDWQEGSKILFLSPEGSGMFSRIDQLIPDKVMRFKHLGTVKNGEEQPADAETKSWEGAIEEYMLEDNQGITKLSVTLDITDGHADYFSDVFPKALKKVKQLAEA
jgi:hypothetical protein